MDKHRLFRTRWKQAVAIVSRDLADYGERLIDCDKNEVLASTDDAEVQRMVKQCVWHRLREFEQSTRGQEETLEAIKRLIDEG